MADMLLSPLVRIVVQKSAELLVQRIGGMRGISDQRERLHDKLLAVEAVLTDAEEQGDANPAVKSWLAKLKSAAYEAYDVLDEFRYEELRRDAVRRGHNVGRVSGFFSQENPVLFRYKISRKLKEVVGRIDKLVTEMERFKFVQGRQGRVVNHDRTHSYVIESEVVGRGEDKEKLVKLLTEVSPTENLMVLPIVGMGGLGKTTLAQLVYNDHRVKEHYKLLIWVCVSEEFDVGALAKLIIDTVVKGDCEVPRDNMELIQMRLRQEMCGTRYLLVLDDVWNDKQDKWEKLRALLNCGDLGSTILVTTRDVRVASIMGTMLSYNLRCLGDEDSWSLFHTRAFSKGVNECQELVEIGKKLVHNCGGLPLGIKTVGSLMSYKHEVREWLAVLKQSTIWEHKHANDEVLPVLRLSYNHLPSYMKQCFAFCAVFPKDYVMEKEKLVQYWMAHGFIPSYGSGDLEMMGNDIFNELVWRSFFQDVEQVYHRHYRSEHEYRSRITCKMHDLMHDLAQFVMRDECLSLLESSKINNTPQYNVRHISLGHFSINEAIECFPATRSLISVIVDNSIYNVQESGFVKSKFLRVLDLFIDCVDIAMVTPGKMKLLRFLDFSSMLYTITLPEAITTLYLLQTLRLNAPSKLPEGMRFMMSLRHLYIEDCSELNCMPPGLGELKCLQTLTCYIVGTGIGNRIGELKTLNLGGQLEVFNLGEVRDPRDAREADMVSKVNLDHLVLCWGMPIRNLYNYSLYDSDFSEVDKRSNCSKAMVVDPFEVLDALKPCNKLKVFRIIEYSGDKFPVWMIDYQMLKNLVELFIIECRRCINVPPLHKLPLLQILHIKCMDNLRHLCCGVFMSAEGGEDAPITFPSLKSFYLCKMSNLDCWCEGDVGEKTSLIFPVLSELSIIDCPKLSAMPVTPLLEEMTIIGNKILSCFATGLTTPRSLTLDGKGGGENNTDGTLYFKPWKYPSFKPWETLQELTIQRFNHIIPPTDARKDEEVSIDVNTTALREVAIISSNFWSSPIPSNSPLWLWKCFRFIEYLYIANCDSLISCSEEELSNLIYLRKMYLYSCKNFLGSLSELPSEMSTRQVLLPKLEHLTISDCPNMIEVPNIWLAKYGSSVALKHLEIASCESLNSIPSSIGGLTALEHLSISGSKKLETLPEWLGGLVALKNLTLNSCESLNSLPSSIGCLTALEILEISECMNLTYLPEGMQGLEALKFLRIIQCPKIRILPEGLLQRLRSLNCIQIQHCPLLQRDFRKHKYWRLLRSTDCND